MEKTDAKSQKVVHLRLRGWAERNKLEPKKKLRNVIHVFRLGYIH